MDYIKSLVNNLASMDSKQFTGWFGEVLTEKELLVVKLFGRDGKMLHNIYVPKDNGETSEIDVLFITRKGIFVIESKNYSGWIFGDEKNTYWTSTLGSGQKNRFYNPIMQNRTHIKWLSKLLEENVPMFSLIVFSDRCVLRKITVSSPDVKVINRCATYSAIKTFWEKSADILSQTQVDFIYAKLQNYTHVDASVKSAHIDSIKNHINNMHKSAEASNVAPERENTSEPESTCNSSSTSEIHIELEKLKASLDAQNSQKCPRCSADLVLRTATKGQNAGKQFYGCSNFPKCRYTNNISD